MAARHRAERARRPDPAPQPPLEPPVEPAAGAADTADTVPVAVQQPEVSVGAERSGAWHSRFVDESERDDVDEKPATHVGRSELADPELHAWLAGAGNPFPARQLDATEPRAGATPIRHRFALRNAVARFTGQRALPTDRE